MNDVEFVKIFKFSLNFGTKKDFVLSNINSNVVSDSIGLILIFIDEDFNVRPLFRCNAESN